MNENCCPIFIRNRLIFEVSKHLQSAAELFDYLKNVDKDVCLNNITTGSGKTIINLRYNEEDT